METGRKFVSMKTRLGFLLFLTTLLCYTRAQDDDGPIINLTFSPNHGSMLGGAELLVIRPQNWGAMSSEDVVCRFDGDILVDGIYENNMVFCVSPTLFKIGAIKADLSVDGGEHFNYTGYYVAVLHERTSPGVIRLNTDEDRWSKPGSYVHFQWDPTELPDTDFVNLEAMGYIEDEPAGTVGVMFWQRLTGGTRSNNDGFFELMANPSDEAPFDVGLIRVVPHELGAADGELGIRALWSDVHMLAYLQDTDFVKHRTYVSEQRCAAWYTNDRKKPDFTDGLEKCPCTVDQMLADTMRYQPDIDCNINGDQSCPKNIDAIHCARTIFVGTDGGGQQCCYDESHQLLMNGDSIYGGRPDRAHAWGTNPMDGPGLVPTLSHWVSDEAPWYYCCIWSDQCWRYVNQRRSGDCYGYEPPGHASGFGDPHFLTFDGLEYILNGRGEFYVMRSHDRLFSIQGRMETFQNAEGEEANATIITALAAKSSDSDAVEIRVDLANDGKSLILVNGLILKFESGVSWLDMTGVSVSSDDDYTYNLMFKNGVAIATRSSVYGLNFRVSVHPDRYWDKTEGLLGQWNDQTNDDFTVPDGTTVNTGSQQSTIFLRFGESWMTVVDDSVFSYDLGTSHQFYYYPDYEPDYEMPTDFNVSQLDMAQCMGFDACIYDVMVHKDFGVAPHTAEAILDYNEAVERSQEVVSCPYIPPPTGGWKEGDSFLEGAVISLGCGDDYILFGSSRRLCDGKGDWSGSSTYCVDELTAGAIIGIVLAILIVFVIIVAAVVIIKKRRKMKKCAITNAKSAKYEKTAKGEEDIKLETGSSVPETGDTAA